VAPSNGAAASLWRLAYGGSGAGCGHSAGGGGVSENKRTAALKWHGKASYGESGKHLALLRQQRHRAAGGVSRGAAPKSASRKGVCVAA